ncbi:S1 family peptidase [Mesorhizobium sp. M0306]|uniref:hypothetical protein n=1 Tax=Mesorhizobium sp. M0306 TaxID=2956932 RepID=UPI00333737E4
MEIPPEVIAAKNELERPLFAAGLITGMDFGVRDEEHPDPEDLVLRIFVADANFIAPEILAAIQFFPFPAVVIQRVFKTTGLPDKSPHRPVVGGSSMASSRFFTADATVHAGTLGAIVTDTLTPNIRYGLSNFHVMCVDSNRASGDPMVQPEPGPLGILAGTQIGTLRDWSFPETSEEGFVDAAICTLTEASQLEVLEIGAVSGMVPPKVAMQVRKRGRTTGLTFGWISGIEGSFSLDFPNMPAVTASDGTLTTRRTFINQIQIHADFPQSIVFGDHGDSGSVVVDFNNQVVGLYWGSGSFSDGDPLSFGLVNPAAAVENALGIKF